MGSRAHRNLIAARRARQQATGAATTTSKPPESKASSNSSDASTESTAVKKSPTGMKSTGSSSSTPKLVNLLVISCYERKALSEGPTIKVFHGLNLVTTISRLLFFATSTTAALLVSPQNEVHLSGILREESVRFLLSWLKNSTVKNDFHAPRLHRDLESALHLCCAAEDLGLLLYVDNTITYQRKMIFRMVPSAPVLAAVEELATVSENGVVPKNFVTMVAERIAYLVRKDLLTSELTDLDDTITEDEYLAIVSGHPKISAAVQKINAPWVARQEAKARRLAAELRKKHAEFKKAERRQQTHEQYDSDMKRRIELLKKLKRQNKVMTLTREEWDLGGRLVTYGDAGIARFF